LLFVLNSLYRIVFLHLVLCEPASCDMINFPQMILLVIDVQWCNQFVWHGRDATV